MLSLFKQNLERTARDNEANTAYLSASVGFSSPQLPSVLVNAARLDSSESSSLDVDPGSPNADLISLS
jgi:hypothetical protein